MNTAERLRRFLRAAVLEAGAGVFYGYLLLAYSLPERSRCGPLIDAVLDAGMLALGHLTARILRRLAVLAGWLGGPEGPA